jgi:asparagine synthase (glutamine-hydrolysing)
MCGIFFYTGPRQPIDGLHRLFMGIQHRGPDTSHFHVHLTHGGARMVVIGFHRLAINGSQPYDEQPFVRDKIHLICNGEIWNHEALSEQCRKADVVPSTLSTSDCACLVSMYRYHADTKQMCRDIDGVFAMVVYDEAHNRLTVARDPVGIRSLYWRQDAESLYVASELKAFPSHFDDVQPFPPGHVATASMGGAPLRLERYTAPPTPPPPRLLHPPSTALHTALHDALVRAVQKRLMSDRSVGCILSGGLDSTLVTAIVCKLQKAQGIETPMRTYTIGMAGGEDLRWARIAADYLGTEHHEFVVSEQEFLNAIPSVVRAVESYDVTTVRASTGNWLVAQKIAALGKDTVLFCGDVADEVFGGYRGFGLAPDDAAFEQANAAMLADVHRFDVLRSEMSFTAHGLEGRVPFADKDMLACAAQLPTAAKMWGGQSGRIEKQLLRELFEGYLPTELLWRRKEAFSDGVSSTQRSWYEVIQDHLAQKQQLLHTRAHLSPYDRESSYYRELFEAHYASVTCIPYFWKHPFTTERDPSARKLTNYDTSSTTRIPTPSTTRIPTPSTTRIPSSIYGRL